jgi:hypothetical protein
LPFWYERSSSAIAWLSVSLPWIRSLSHTKKMRLNLSSALASPSSFAPAFASEDRTFAVALAVALARSRIMGARYNYYLLADSPDGLRKEADLSGIPAAQTRTSGNIRMGFVYERVPHVTLGSISNKTR